MCKILKEYVYNAKLFKNLSLKIIFYSVRVKINFQLKICLCTYQFKTEVPKINLSAFFQIVCTVSHCHKYKPCSEDKTESKNKPATFNQCLRYYTDSKDSPK